MPWAKIDVGYLANPKLIGLHPQGKLLHLASILWVSEHLTDGIVPASALHHLGQMADIAPTWHARRARQLVQRGLWDDYADGWVVHDYARHNASSMRSAVEASRAAALERQRRHRGGVTA